VIDLTARGPSRVPRQGGRGGREQHNLDGEPQRSVSRCRAPRGDPQPLDDRGQHRASHALGWVHRVVTDDRTVADIAAEMIGLAGWLAE
jgi:hypothetical protein